MSVNKDVYIKSYAKEIIREAKKTRYNYTNYKNILHSRVHE